MTDQTTQPEQPQAATEVNVTISLPSVWLISHYETYMKARLRYINEKRKPIVDGEDNEPVSELLADFMGGLALIKEGVVHVTGLDELSDALRTNGQGQIDLALAAFISTQIVGDLNRALSRFLTWKVSSTHGISPNGTTHL